MRFLRFVSVGAVISLLSMACNYVFVRYFETPVSATYCSVYAFFLLISFFVNSRFSFGTRVIMANAATYFSVYLSGMLFGFLLIEFYQWLIQIPPYFYHFLVIPVTALWNFLLCDRLLGR